jgi:hypothetical protein
MAATETDCCAPAPGLDPSSRCPAGAPLGPRNAVADVTDYCAPAPACDPSSHGPAGAPLGPRNAVAD